MPGLLYRTGITATLTRVAPTGPSSAHPSEASEVLTVMFELVLLYSSHELIIATAGSAQAELTDDYLTGEATAGFGIGGGGAPVA